jgi:predicted nucleic acid-binding protein
MAESVLDASVAISWCFPGDPTEDTPYSRSILKELIVRDAIVPEIWAFEIANNIFVSHRKRNLINEQHITEYLGLLKALPIRVQSQTLWTNVELESCARRSDIAAYDASCRFWHYGRKFHEQRLMRFELFPMVPGESTRRSMLR